MISNKFWLAIYRRVNIANLTIYHEDFNDFNQNCWMRNNSLTARRNWIQTPKEKHWINTHIKCTRNSLHICGLFPVVLIQQFYGFYLHDWTWLSEIRPISLFQSPSSCFSDTFKEGPPWLDARLDFHLWKGKAIFILQRALPLENLQVNGKLLKGTKAKTRGMASMACV